MNENQFYNLLQRRLAQVSIGPSAIRNQGASGLITVLRDYLQNKVELNKFINSLKSEIEYTQFLDLHTSNIVRLFPEKGKSWGAARKGLNLFLREIVYSKFFSSKYLIPKDFIEFNEFVRFMEVPLDRDVAKGLILDSNGHLPKWINIKQLSPEISDQYQFQALIIAETEKIARVNLDLKYWRADVQLEQ